MSDRARARESGALSLSYVIIVPVFLFAVMFITQAAMWYLGRSAALSAARQGVDAGRVQSGSLAAGRAAARSFAAQAGRGFFEVTGVAAARSANTVVVTVTGRVPSLVPGLPITVSQVAEAPVERFTVP
jgi:hypothetical protein